MLIGVAIYLGMGLRKRKKAAKRKYSNLQQQTGEFSVLKPFFTVYGPLMLTVLAIPFILADIVRHILQDEGIWKECERAEGEIWGPQCTWSSSQYRCTLPHQEHRPSGESDCADEKIGNLSFIGLLFTIGFTYFGFFLLTTGTLWNANIVDQVKKIKQQWKQIKANGSN